MESSSTSSYRLSTSYGMNRVSVTFLDHQTSVRRADQGQMNIATLSSADKWGSQPGCLYGSSGLAIRDANTVWLLPSTREGTLALTT